MTYCYFYVFKNKKKKQTNKQNFLFLSLILLELSKHQYIFLLLLSGSPTLCFLSILFEHTFHSAFNFCVVCLIIKFSCSEYPWTDSFHCISCTSHCKRRKVEMLIKTCDLIKKHIYSNAICISDILYSP